MPKNYSTIEHQAQKQTPKTQTKIVLTIRVVLTLENHNIISYGKKVNFTNTDFTENQRYSFWQKQMPKNYSTIEHQAQKQTPKTQTKIVLTIRVVLTLENHNIISYGKKVNFTNTDFTENQRYSFYINWNLQRQSSPGANCPHKFRTRFTGCCYCCHWYSVIEPFLNSWEKYEYRNNYEN